jgi:hypothetical protein
MALEDTGPRRKPKPTDTPPRPTTEPACCTEWFLDGPHGWRQRLVCGFLRDFGEGCEHAHHDDEVWLA